MMKPLRKAKRKGSGVGVLAGIHQFWSRFGKNKGAVAGLCVLLVVVFSAVFADVISSYPPDRPAVGPRLHSPSAEYPMGTDNLGRDVFSGVVHGSRVSLMIGVAASLTSIALGTLVGSIAGFFGGWVDEVSMRLSELFQSMPRFLFALVIVVFFGSSIWNVVIVIGLLSWPRAARMVRAEFLRLRQSEFVLAAKALGTSSRRIIFRQILPNTLHILLVTGTLEVGAAIVIEAGLSFLGAGDPNLVSWGHMLHNAQRFLRTAWWFSVFPGGAIFVTVLAMNMVGDGINDALNPRLLYMHSR